MSNFASRGFHVGSLFYPANLDWYVDETANLYCKIPNLF